MSLAEACRSLLRVTLPTLAVCVLVLELVFRFLVPASDPPMGWFAEEPAVYRFATDRESGLVTTGPFARQRARWRINNEGWNSPVDYSRSRTRPLVAVIGDSYVEAFQVDTNKTYPSLLRQALAGRWDVYSFGVSGAPLSQYLHLGRHVVAAFDPDVIVINVVHNDFAESILRLNSRDRHWLLLDSSGGRIREVPPQANRSFTQYSTLKKLLRRSALVRYFVFNLGATDVVEKLGARHAEVGANIKLAAVAANRDDIRRATRYIFTRMREAFGERRVLIVMDAPRIGIYTGHIDDELKFLHALTAEMAQQVGFTVLDLTEPMRRAYAVDQVRFESQWDGHWNEYGHTFVAGYVEGALREVTR